MHFVGYDFEVFKHDWCVVFKDYTTKEYTVIWNDNSWLKEVVDRDDVHYGFNTKHYDQFIMKAACCGASPEELKEINDYIIVYGGNGWDHPIVQQSRYYYHNMDLMDDMQMGLSLKAIEGHIGMNIEETEVDFNIDRPLTEEEKALTEKYCKHDVDAAEMILDLRWDYINNKIRIGELAGLTPEKAVSMTNAKLTAAMLQAQKKPHDDERKYVYPEKLKREYIPQEVFDFFDRMYDPNLSDDEVFKGNLKIKVGDCPITLGFGGIHGAVPNYIWEEERRDVEDSTSEP